MAGEPSMQPDIAVVGAGPAAMMAALALAAEDFSVALVGPAVDLEDRRTTALLEPSIDFLKDLGLGADVDEFGTPMATMRLLDGSRRLIRAPGVSFEAHEIGQPRFGLNCPNKSLNAMLDAAIHDRANITRIDGIAARYRFERDRVSISLQTGEEIHARAVVASDGRNSKAREAAKISVRRWFYPQTAAVGVVRHEKPHDLVSTELHTETGPYTFVPMPSTDDGIHRSSFVCVLSPGLADQLKAMPDDDASHFLNKRSQGVLGSLGLEDGVQLWPLEGLAANMFAKPGLFLIGEAAHAFPPIGAQGLNLSIRDVKAVVETLSDAKGEDTPISSQVLAARYNAKRRTDVWSRTFAVDALNRSLLTNFPLVHAGRSLALGAAKSLPGLRTGLMRLGLGPFSLGETLKRVASIEPKHRPFPSRSAP